MNVEPDFAGDIAGTTPIILVRANPTHDWKATLNEDTKRWLNDLRFEPQPGNVALIPGARKSLAGVIAGWKEAGEDGPGYLMADILGKLPSGDYHLRSSLCSHESEESALAALFMQYEFSRYTSVTRDQARLCLPEGVDGTKLRAIARAEFLCRDLINTPAADMGPEELETEFRNLGKRFGAAVSSITGDGLLSSNLAMIHAVGRGSDRLPRLLDMNWGDTGPLIVAIGKGVCFDTGGVDIKTVAGMQFMKKDMAGAAAAMGLASVIMELELPVRLRVLVPAVENAISGRAMLPGDVLASRAGLTVEVTNTDAEGRLILADAMALADEDEPSLMMTFATLTGAARIALGPDIPAFFTKDDEVADELYRCGVKVRDPLWRLPLWGPYSSMLESDLADIANAASRGLGGAITAALFLDRFVSRSERYVHFDMFGWSERRTPAFARGGKGQAFRAMFEALPRVLGI